MKRAAEEIGMVMLQGCAVAVGMNGLPREKGERQVYAQSARVRDGQA